MLSLLFSITKRYKIFFLGFTVLLCLSSILLLFTLTNSDNSTWIPWPHYNYSEYESQNFYINQNINSSLDTNSSLDITTPKVESFTPSLTSIPSKSVTSSSISFISLIPTNQPQIPTQDQKSFNLIFRNETRSPDGYIRSVLTINNQFPGPTIIVNKGDKVRINVMNLLGVPTSLHVHGIDQRINPFMDGVPYITQCPIENGSSFVYSFDALKSGTYWYYSSYETQRIDGLYGAFIVNDPIDQTLFNYQKENIILLSDWYHNEGSELLNFYQFGNVNSSIIEPFPKNTIINGKGVFNCKKYKFNDSMRENCDSYLGSIKYFYFEPNKKYRLRIINTSAMTSFFFSIDGHILQIVEVEGTLTKLSKPYHRIPIHVAQRYSVIPTRLPKYMSISSFMIRGEVNKNSFQSSALDSEKLDDVIAILSYSTDDSEYPTTVPWSYYENTYYGTMNNFKLEDLDSFELESLTDENIPTNTILYEMTMIISRFYNFTTDNVTTNNVTTNNVTTNNVTTNSFTTDNVTTDNVTNSVINNMTNQNINVFNQNSLIDGAIYSSICSKTRGIYVYQPNKTTSTIKEVLEGNIKKFDHYWNAYHGHSFWVLDRGNESTPYNSSKELSYKTNLIKRDTVTIPALGWTLIRIRINNPGIWAFGNPIMWHLSTGMMGQIVELPSSLKKSIPPTKWCKMCESYKLDICDNEMF
ncbi:Multicopper oxidase [Gigaspora rosea]|uniref:Multicopper oxidase n=1 Tax=Gigaspora rosea TaxID=44941 RepID=A0A397V8N0_9GLOM|nr:Multicopper oxidase [Gigaspora rosea]